VAISSYGRPADLEVSKLWLVICPSVDGCPSKNMVSTHRVLVTLNLKFQISPPTVPTKIRFNLSRTASHQNRLKAEGLNRRLIHLAGSGSFLPTTTMSTAESSSGSRNTQWPPQKQMPCRFWKQGNCPYGHKCKFSHDDRDRGFVLVGYSDFSLGY